jgi:hypothetical protein
MLSVAATNFLQLHIHCSLEGDIEQNPAFKQILLTKLIIKVLPTPAVPLDHAFPLGQSTQDFTNLVKSYLEGVLH